jgi:hypothetical protein
MRNATLWLLSKTLLQSSDPELSVSVQVRAAAISKHEPPESTCRFRHDCGPYEAIHQCGIASIKPNTAVHHFTLRGDLVPHNLSKDLMRSHCQPALRFIPTTSLLGTCFSTAIATESANLVDRSGPVEIMVCYGPTKGSKWSRHHIWDCNAQDHLVCKPF